MPALIAAAATAAAAERPGTVNRMGFDAFVLVVFELTVFS